MKKFGLYIHFPFCLQKCSYCDFYSVPYDVAVAGKWLEALLVEIDMWKNGWANLRVSTLYFGGGSPNLLSSNQFSRLNESLKTAFDMSELVEFTVETNPVKRDRDFLTQLRDNGVNRVNVGVQSFNEGELQTLGRIHSVGDVEDMFESLVDVGFEHIGLDLIYGIPGQSIESWLSSLDRALNTGADHLSFYNLSYEEGTLLTSLWKQGKVIPVDNDVERQMYLEACRLLSERGYIHYEISNWAGPNCESRHNRSYWEGQSYLGLGPAAHSYNWKSRWWNVRSVEKYIQMIDSGQFPIDQQEELSEQDRGIEQLFLRLRTNEGLSRSRFENLFQIDFNRIIDALIMENLDEEYWIFDGNRFKLTPGGWFVSDSIIYKISGFIEEFRHDHKKDRIGT